jgi:hypothetical protein
LANNDGALPVAIRCDIYKTQLHLSRFAIMTREVCGNAMGPPLPSCCMLRDSLNPVPTGRYGRDGDAVW